MDTLLAWVTVDPAVLVWRLHITVCFGNLSRVGHTGVVLLDTLDACWTRLMRVGHAADMGAGRGSSYAHRGAQYHSAYWTQAIGVGHTRKMLDTLEWGWTLKHLDASPKAQTQHPNLTPPPKKRKKLSDLQFHDPDP